MKSYKQKFGVKNINIFKPFETYYQIALQMSLLASSISLESEEQVGILNTYSLNTVKEHFKALSSFIDIFTSQIFLKNIVGWSRYFSTLFTLLFFIFSWQDIVSISFHFFPSFFDAFQLSFLQMQRSKIDLILQGL